MLFGANSAGKTTLMQALLMLSQTLASRDRESALIANVPEQLELGSYRDFIRGHDTKATLGMQVECLASSEELRMFRPDADQPPQRVRLAASFRQAARNRIAVNSVDLLLSGRTIYRLTSPARPGRPSFKVSVAKAAPDHDELVQIGTSTSPAFRVLARRNFYVDPMAIYYDRSGKADKDLREAVFLAEAAFSSIERNLLNIRHLAPLREPARRFYLAGGETPSDVGAQGELAPQLLYLSSESKQRGEVMESARKWLRRLGLAVDLNVVRVGKAHYELQLMDPATGFPVNLADVGFGVSQILPVVVLGFFSSARQTVLFEQPEIHLHPRVQAELADMFIDLALRNRRLIVETHSEHLLTRLQRRIAQGQIAADEVGIYFVEVDEGGSRLRRIEVTPTGELLDWPAGFFAEGLTEAFEYAKAAREAADAEFADPRD